MRKRVVVDVDAGTDDAVALLLLLALEREKNVEVLGVTCTHGNTTVDNVCRNVLLTLESISRSDVPVYRGAEGPLVPLENPNVFVSEPFHGVDGFGDKNFLSPKGKILPENGIVALNRLAKENGGIYLICLGPLTNIALTLRTYSDFPKFLHHVYIMGGNTEGIGNNTSAAEFNFCKDPEAAHVVLSSLTCPITILPWESCIKTDFSIEERFQKIGSIPKNHITLINEVESNLYHDPYWCPCDAFLMAAFLDEAVIQKSRNLHLSVELHGVYTRGQGVVDHCRRKKSNVRVIDKLDITVFRNMILKMAAFTP